MANDPDTEALGQLGRDMERAKRQFLGKLSDRGYAILAGKAVNGKSSGEVPYATGNMQEGVAPPAIDYDRMQSLLTVSARTGRQGSRVAEVFDADGNKVRSVTLRPSPAYNYAEVVALGNKAATLTPSNAKAFMIPVSTRPTGEGYLMVGGQIFVLRRSRKGKAANPFHERAAKRIENEAPGIGQAILSKVFT